MKHVVAIVMLAGALGVTLPARAAAQDAATEKALIANEHAVNEAFIKGDLAAFKQYVSADGWSVDPMGTRTTTADLFKEFPAMTKGMKITKWDITDMKVIWADPSTAVTTYKWVGTGTFNGQPVASPTWASTVWTKRDAKWVAVFHHESLIQAPPAAKK